MDEYYGMKIKFMTRGGSIHGILKGLDEDKELFMIEIGEEEFKLDVNEVVDMEPEECGVEEDGCSKEDRTVEDSKENMIKEGSKVDTLEDSKVDLNEERPKVNPFKNEGFKEDDNPPIEKDVAFKDNLPKDKGITEEDNIPKDTPPTLTMPLKDNPSTHTVPLKDTPPPPIPFSTPIPLFHYNSLLSLSFSRFGPTKEEFISISSLNLFKLLKSYFSFNSKIDIILGEDPLNNSIGLTLGRLLLNNDYDIRVVGSPRNLEIVNYHYLYRENKGITLKKEREDNEFVIDLRSNVDKDNNGSKEGSKDGNIIIKKVIFTFGLVPNNNNNINNIFIHIALGLGILEFVKDLKEYFLIDGMINEGIYKKFGRTRKGMKSINRIRV